MYSQTPHGVKSWEVPDVELLAPSPCEVKTLLSPQQCVPAPRPARKLAWAWASSVLLRLSYGVINCLPTWLNSVSVKLFDPEPSPSVISLVFLAWPALPPGLSGVASPTLWSGVTSTHQKPSMLPSDMIEIEDRGQTSLWTRLDSLTKRYKSLMER